MPKMINQPIEVKRAAMTALLIQKMLWDFINLTINGEVKEQVSDKEVQLFHKENPYFINFVGMYTTVFNEKPELVTVEFMLGTYALFLNGKSMESIIKEGANGSKEAIPIIKSNPHIKKMAGGYYNSLNKIRHANNKKLKKWIKEVESKKERTP